MKIKSIAAICKKNKQVVLLNRYSDSGTLSQYIGDGSAVYPIHQRERRRDHAHR